MDSEIFRSAKILIVDDEQAMVRLLELLLVHVGYTNLRSTHDLLEAEKLATMGNLLAGVAHELNSPLSVILGQVGLFATTAADDSARARAREIGEAAERCAHIVRRFLTIAQRHPPERGHVSLNLLLRDAVELLAFELRIDNIEVQLDLESDLPLVWADGHQLKQVAVDLIANARQAMREASAPRRLSF